MALSRRRSWPYVFLVVTVLTWNVLMSLLFWLFLSKIFEQSFGLSLDLLGCCSCSWCPSSLRFATFAWRSLEWMYRVLLVQRLLCPDCQTTSDRPFRTIYKSPRVTPGEYTEGPVRSQLRVVSTRKRWALRRKNVEIESSKSRNWSTTLLL